jgi:hypothetical protein
MHDENEKERFDDLFVIVIVFVLVRNLNEVPCARDPHVTSRGFYGNDALTNASNQAFDAVPYQASFPG